MAAGDPPTVARRRARLSFHAGEATDLTRHEVAQEMEWSLSKVIRIETGYGDGILNDRHRLLRISDGATRTGETS